MNLPRLEVAATEAAVFSGERGVLFEHVNPDGETIFGVIWFDVHGTYRIRGLKW